MRKKITLILSLSILTVILSCKKNDDILDSANKRLSAKANKSNSNQKNGLLSSEIYVFDWDNSIGLEDNFNAECATHDDFFLSPDNSEIIFKESFANGGLDLGLITGSRSGIYETTFGRYYTVQAENNKIIFEAGANSKIDEFCECIINSSPTSFVEKTYQ